MKFAFFTYCDRNNILPAKLLAKQVYRISKNRLHIFTDYDCGIQIADDYKIEFLHNEKFKNSGGHISEAAYGRIVAFSKFREFDWVIYLDTDILYRIDIIEFLSAAEPGIYMADHRLNFFLNNYGIVEESYFNSGVIAVGREYIDTWDRHLSIQLDSDLEYIYHDQCLINLALRGKISKLPDEFNYLVTWDEIPMLSNVHFVGPRKPWNTVLKNDLQKQFMAHVGHLSFIERLDFAGLRVLGLLRRILNAFRRK